MIERVARIYGEIVNARLMGEGAWVIGGQVGSALGNLVGLKILTQILSTDVYGQVNLLTVAMILPSWILFAPFLQAGVRFYAASRESDELPSLLRTLLRVYFLNSVIVAVLGMVLLASGILGRAGFREAVIGIAIVAFLLDTWFLLGASLSAAARLRKRVALLATLTAWLRPLSAYIFVLALGPTVFSVMLGYLITPLLLLPLALGPVWRDAQTRGKAVYRREVLAKLVAYGSPFALWGIFVWSQNYADRYVLELILGAKAVGPYAAACQVAALPFSLGFAFLGQLVTPIAFDRAGSGSDLARLESASGMVRATARLFMGIGVVIVLLYAMWGAGIMGLITHAEYIISNGVLVVLAIGALVSNTALIFTTAIFAHNRPKLLLWAYSVPGVLSVPLSWVLVGKVAVLGAAMANAITACVFFAIVWWITRRLSLQALARGKLQSSTSATEGNCLDG